MVQISRVGPSRRGMRPATAQAPRVCPRWYVCHFFSGGFSTVDWSRGHANSVSKWTGRPVTATGDRSRSTRSPHRSPVEATGDRYRSPVRPPPAAGLPASGRRFPSGRRPRPTRSPGRRTRSPLPADRSPLPAPGTAERSPVAATGPPLPAAASTTEQRGQCAEIGSGAVPALLLGGAAAPDY